MVVEGRIGSFEVGSLPQEIATARSNPLTVTAFHTTPAEALVADDVARRRGDVRRRHQPALRTRLARS